MNYNKFNFDEVVYNEFLKQDITKQDYYGSYLLAMKKREELFKKLPTTLQDEFDQAIKANEIYEQESSKGFARFVIMFIRQIF